VAAKLDLELEEFDERLNNPPRMLRRLRATRFSTLSGSLSNGALPTGAVSPPHPQPPPADGFGVKLFTLIADHPWRFFGPLLGALVAYLGRSMVSSSNQDALASAIDATSPLHPREAAALGRVNDVSRVSWDGAVGAIFEALSAHLAARFGGRKLSEEEFTSATVLRPSEVEAALRRCGAPPLVGCHALRRAAAWLAMRAAGAGPYQPATDGEARAFLEAAAAARRGGGWALATGHAGAGPGGTELAGEAPPGGLLRGALEALGLSGDPPLPPPWNVALAPEEGDPSRFLDAPLPLLDALCLYSALLSGGGEVGYVDGGGGGEDEGGEGALPPSRRVALLAGIARRCVALRAAWVEGAGAGGGAPPAAPPPLPDGGGDPALAPAYTLRELALLVEVLARTFQVPSRNRTGVASSWPVQRFALTDGAAIVAAGLVEAGVELGKTPAPPMPLLSAAPGETGLKTGVPKPAPGEPQPLPPHAAPRAWLTRDEARRALLQSRAVCVWGECNSSANRPEYKGGIF
jgi:hypothetical protein